MAKPLRLKLPLLVLAVACVSCTPALVAVCLGVSAAGVTAAVVVENDRPDRPADAGSD